jgi:hypothetical protein
MMKATVTLMVRKFQENCKLQAELNKFRISTSLFIKVISGKCKHTICAGSTIL